MDSKTIRRAENQARRLIHYLEKGMGAAVKKARAAGEEQYSVTVFCQPFHGEKRQRPRSDYANNHEA